MIIFKNELPLDHERSIQSVIDKWSKLVYCVPSRSEEHARKQARDSIEEHLEAEGLEMEYVGITIQDYNSTLAKLKGR